MEHLSSSSDYCGNNAAESIVFYVVLRRSLIVRLQCIFLSFDLRIRVTPLVSSHFS